MQTFSHSPVTDLGCAKWPSVFAGSELMTRTRLVCCKKIYITQKSYRVVAILQSFPRFYTAIHCYKHYHRDLAPSSVLVTLSDLVPTTDAISLLYPVQSKCLHILIYIYPQNCNVGSIAKNMNEIMKAALSDQPTAYTVQPILKTEGAYHTSL